MKIAVSTSSFACPVIYWRGFFNRSKKMRYLGSKARLVKQLAPIVLDGHDDSKPYIEPFVGGGNMIAGIDATHRIGYDANKYVVALLDALANGWEPPKYFPASWWQDVKDNKESYSDVIVGYAGFAISYGGMFFKSYARGGYRSNGEPRDHVMEAYRKLVKMAPKLQGCQFQYCSYENGKIPEGSTVYCDPPYEGTAGYNVGISHDHFWDWCRHLSRVKGCRVFVSSYQAPDDMEIVYERHISNSFTKDGKAKESEKLFKV